MNAASDDTPAALVIGHEVGLSEDCQRRTGYKAGTELDHKAQVWFRYQKSKILIRDQESMTLGLNSAFCDNKLHSLGLFN